MTDDLFRLIALLRPDRPYRPAVLAAVDQLDAQARDDHSLLADASAMLGHAGLALSERPTLAALEELDLAATYWRISSLAERADRMLSLE